MFTSVEMNSIMHQSTPASSPERPQLAKARQRRIAELVAEHGEVVVAELAPRFGVSGMTIRRDLKELQRHGLAQRTHGGAVAPPRKAAPVERPLRERLEHEAPEKQRIARAVAGFVRDGETVFIGSGTSTLKVAEALRPDRQLTVVTNAVTIVDALAGTHAIALVVAGGVLRREEMSLIGHIAESALADIRVDRVIMGARGVDPEHGLTSDHLLELMTDRAILRTGGEIIIVADHTKLGRVATSRMAPVAAASMLVTDKAAPAHIVDAIRQAGVEVVLV
jgi:DeoR/GlpR family transcriptional regulator of sugar metabolism